MKTGKLSILGFGLMLLAFAPDVTADEQRLIDFGLTADYYGKYIWRGQNLVNDPVFQPGITASYGGLTAGVWGNLETTNYNNNAGDLTEIDYYIDYSGTLSCIDGISYSLGVIYYQFHSTSTRHTTELYWGLSFDLPLSPSVTVYHDIDEADGAYISLGIGHSIEKIYEFGANTPVDIEIGASFGWAGGNYNKYYWGLDSSKANDLAFSLAFPVTMGGWTLSPSLNYVTLLSSDIRDTDAYRTESDYFFAGIGVSTEF